MRGSAVTADDYSETSFWSKLTRVGRVAGRALIERALRLYYAARDPRTPPSIKRIIYAALAYFIVPIDLIPDFLPGVGYIDDLGTLTVTLFLVSAYVTPEIKSRASAKTAEWFGAT